MILPDEAATFSFHEVRDNKPEAREQPDIHLTTSQLCIQLFKGMRFYVCGNHKGDHCDNQKGDHLRFGHVQAGSLIFHVLAPVFSSSPGTDSSLRSSRRYALGG